MKIKRLIVILCNILFIVFLLVSCRSPIQHESVTAKPWSYWWWMGNSVTKEDITYNLEKLAYAGIGGVHIVPIYGEVGDESNYIDYLSPKWMEMLVHTANEAQRLGMGVDMTSGTGWPFGGPWVDSTFSAKRLFLNRTDIQNTSQIKSVKAKTVTGTIDGYAIYNHKDIPLFSTRGHQLPPENIWQKAAYLITAEQKPTKQKVKRAAPGDEGLVVDYFSTDAISLYMKKFKDAFSKTSFTKSKIRAFYNDSYEVFGANYTKEFFDVFEKNRGYDLMPYLNYLIDTTMTETKHRIICDYCETISDLLYSSSAKWVDKSHEMGFITRYQAHGSPGNLLDLYGLSDIPETETFGSSGHKIPGLLHDPDYRESSFGRPDPLTMKFASSAANVKGKSLVSSESASWLGEHFKVSLAQIKPQIDELFISGINHLFFHGTPYSPKEAAWPGRLFYASTNFGPSSHFWNELPLLNKYIEQCQNILQNASPDNDILLYFAIHEDWQNYIDKKIVRLFEVHHAQEWLQNKSTGKLASKLWDKGFTFDYISDKSLLNDIAINRNKISCGNNSYKAIVIPKTSIIPVSTLHRLLELARQGVNIYFENDISEDVPGLNDIENRKKELIGIKKELLSLSNVYVSSDICLSLSQNHVGRETMADNGLNFIRKQIKGKPVYFIANLSDSFREGWIKLDKMKGTSDIYDVQNNVRGRAERKDDMIYLQLVPGSSCFILPSDTKQPYPYIKQKESGMLNLSEDWDLKPLHGDPSIPEVKHLKHLITWTDLDDEYYYFSGTVRYRKEFKLNNNNLADISGFILKIRQLHETATVRINGEEIGTVWSIPYEIKIPKKYLKNNNILELDVTNVSFNRIIDLDKRNVQWKNFHDINFVNIRYEKFDASNKEAVPSGIIGDISLIPYYGCNH